jgi:hypothetical protein
MSEAWMKAKHQVRHYETELEYREAWLRRYGGVEGNNEKTREAHLKELISKDAEHKGLKMRYDELLLLRDRLEIDMTSLRDQFTVVKLQTQERIAFPELRQKLEPVSNVEQPAF